MGLLSGGAGPRLVENERDASVSAATVVHRFYAAVAARDFETAGACFTSDARWHLPGSRKRSTSLVCAQTQFYPDYPFRAIRAMWSVRTDHICAHISVLSCQKEAVPQDSGIA